MQTLLYPPDLEFIVERLERLRDQRAAKGRPLSYDAIGGGIGVSAATISNFVNHKDPENSKLRELAQTLKVFLDREALKDSAGMMKLPFAETRQAGTLLRAYQYALQFNRLVVVIGGSGFGKSRTIEELRALKAEILHKTEQQVVQLAIAIARRIVHREVSLDRGLLATMARVALERLGASASATIRLHPDDYAVVMSGRTEAVEGSVATVVADPLVRRGGCLVQSDFGLIDIGIDEQIQEVSAALLGQAEAERRRPRRGDAGHRRRARVQALAG